MPAANERATTRPWLRTTLLFLALWIPSAALDDLTTEIARRQGGWRELNPSGFVPPSVAIERELMLTLELTTAVLVGSWLLRNALGSAARTTPDEFWQALFEHRAWALILVKIPLFVAIGRYGVVISNACYLTIGWSPIDKVLWLPLEALFQNDDVAHVVAILISMALLWYPVTTLIFRLLYLVNGGRQKRAKAEA